MPVQLLVVLIWVAVPLLAIPSALVAITATRRRLQAVAPEGLTAGAETSSEARAA